MILKNENDIYIYFETIGQLEPQNVLDAGMFLKRIGSVSRKVMSRKIPSDVRLDGVDFFSETSFPIWEKIYNSIMDAPAFLESRSGAEYDLTVFLGTEALYQKQDFEAVSEKAAKHTRYLLADRNLKQWNKILPDEKIKELNLEEKKYYLFDFGA